MSLPLEETKTTRLTSNKGQEERRHQRNPEFLGRAALGLGLAAEACDGPLFILVTLPWVPASCHTGVLTNIVRLLVPGSGAPGTPALGWRVARRLCF